MFQSTTAEQNAEQARAHGAVRNGLATPVHGGEPESNGGNVRPIYHYDRQNR